MISLYSFFRSSSSYRCRIALNLKQIPYECIPVNLRTGEQKGAAHLEINPHGAVPALRSESAVFTQSLAIIEWLEECYPGHQLMPLDIDLRAMVRSAAQLIACDIQPLQNLRTLTYLRQVFDASDESVNEWCQHWIRSGLVAFEEMVRVSGGGAAFSFGDSPGLADVCLIPQLFSAQRFGVDVSKLTRILEIEKQCSLLPEFISAHPDNQDDAL